MATTHSASIDLYEESREGFAEDLQDRPAPGETEARRPADNGDRDEPAIAAGSRRWDQVLGW